jgi:hypothetical protein
MAVASVVFAGWLLNLDRQQWFVTDEFDYFNPGQQPLIPWLLSPHNEHTIVFTKAWFGLLSQLVGLRHYVLYILPLVVAHLVVVASIYRLTWRATSSRVIATGTGLVSLAMGAAAGTLTWAGQLQYVGSVAAGLIVVILAIESSGRRSLAVVVAAATLGTLNGSAFIAFGLAAAVVYVRRRLWTPAVLVAVIPLGWEAISRLVWAPQDPYAASGLGQILREGPSFTYSILDMAISQTVGDTHMSSALLAFLVLGTLTLISVNVRWRRTPLSGRIVAALAIAAILTMFSIIVARLSLGSAAWSGGGYSYLFLVSLLPVGGILLGHLARSKSALVGSAGVFLAITMIGAVTISDNAASLQSWKADGARLMQTAAAELDAGMSTYPDQVPVPGTAPTVSQQQIRMLAASGELDKAVAGPVEIDQLSLNVQWRIVPAGQTTGICRDLAPGTAFEMSAGASVSMVGLGPSAAVELRYPSSIAVRQVQVPGTASNLETLSQHTGIVTIQAASVRVCQPSWG